MPLLGVIVTATLLVWLTYRAAKWYHEEFEGEDDLVKVVGTRALERLGECTAFRSPSETRPGLFHITIVHSNGSIRCSCEGFCLQGHCWHIDKIPLCMKWGVYDVNLGRGTIQCHYVQGHSGSHSWGDSPEAPEARVEEYKPNEGLPQ